ncbi:DUF6493 family protein [Streptomyces sp. NPDC001889]
MKELLDAVRGMRVAKVPELLRQLTPAERKEALTELKALRAELRGWDWNRWRERGGIAGALLVAGAGCQTGAAAAASWIGSRDLRAGSLPAGKPLLRRLVEVLADREPEWLGDLAHRLAARPSTAQDDYPLIRELVELAGCPAPTTDGFVEGWVDSLSHRGDRLELLRLDPYAPVLVPRLFELAVFPSRLSWAADPDDPAHWPSAIVSLGESGVLERSALLDGCVARLLRGGRPSDTQFFLTLLKRLAPTPDEEAARVPDWSGMAADGGLPVASHAQSVLGRLAEAGVLPLPALAEVTGAVLFRTEKKLVRSQLTLLGKVLRKHAKDPAALAVLLPVVADGFGHGDTHIQERALKLVARCLPAAGAELREELAGAAGGLSPVHRAAAEAAFGALLPGAGTEVAEETLPPVPERRRLGPPPSSVAELVEDLVVLLRGRQEASESERLLDGLIRLIHREREPLTAALEEALADQWWLHAGHQRYDRDLGRGTGVEVVIATLLGRVSAETLDSSRTRSGGAASCPHEGLGEMTRARYWEAACRVGSGSPPFLLATPTWVTGALDAEVLVERLREYGRLGVEPLATDFVQALLRVERGGDGVAADGAAGRAADAARALGTAEGDRLAEWLCGTGPVPPALAALSPGDGTGSGAPGEEGPGEPRRRPDTWLRRSPAETTRRVVHGMRERLALHQAFPRSFRWLGSDFTDLRCSGYSCVTWEPRRLLALPHDREAVARWMAHAVVMSAEWADGAPRCLPALAEAEARPGPAGPALHRVLAAGTGARRADDRLAAVDGLLVLAARGQLDTALFGRELARLVRHEGLKPNRLADAARTAAVTGAYGTVGAILAAALPALLRAEPLPRAMGEILAVAAECAERSGGVRGAAGPGLSAGEAIPGLAELAGRGGSSQAVTQAVRLLAAAGAPTPTPEMAGKC